MTFIFIRIYQSSRFKAKDFFFSFLQVVWSSESEFNEFEPRLKSAKNRFQSRAGLNLEILRVKNLCLKSEISRFSQLPLPFTQYISMMSEIETFVWILLTLIPIYNIINIDPDIQYY